jgi:hypothetical protein
MYFCPTDKEKGQVYPSPFDEISMGKDKFAIDTSF